MIISTKVSIMAMEAMLNGSGQEFLGKMPSRSRRVVQSGFGEELGQEFSSVMPNLADPMELAQAPFKGEVRL